MRVVTMGSKSNREWIFALEELISEDPGGRGIRHLRCMGELAEAAQALWEQCGERRSVDRSVVIATGFFVPEAEEIETDGPPGAFALARALAELGVRSVLVSDEAATGTLRSARRGMAVRAGDGDGSGGIGADPELVSFPGQQHAGAAEQMCARLVREACAVVAIERVGPSAAGRCYTFRGVDITEQTAPVERLFHRAASYGVLSIGMGDGGNEIGMGKVWSQVARHLPEGRRVGCSVPTDWLIAAGVSNWAAYGLVAALSVLSGHPLLPDVEEERSRLEAHVAAGEVDGMTLRADLSVDGIPWSEHEALLNRLHGVMREALAGERHAS